MKVMEGNRGLILRQAFASRGTCGLQTICFHSYFMPIFHTGTSLVVNTCANKCESGIFLKQNGPEIIHRFCFKVEPEDEDEPEVDPDCGIPKAGSDCFKKAGVDPWRV